MNPERYTPYTIPELKEQREEQILIIEQARLAIDGINKAIREKVTNETN